MTTDTRSALETRSPWLTWAVLAAAIIEVVAPLVTIAGPGSSPGGGSGPDLLITPAGWAFSIWGVIYALAIAQAIGTLVVGPSVVSRRLQADLLVLYLGGALWIVMAGLDSSLATAAALLLMLIAAVDAVLVVAREPITPRWLSVLTRASVGLYAGWVTAAFFLNVGTALVDAGPVEADELAWQLVLLVVAAAALLALAIRTHVVAFSVAGTWALFGIAVAAGSDGTTEVVAAAVVSAAVLVLTTIAVQVSGRRRVTA